MNRLFQKSIISTITVLCLHQNIFAQTSGERISTQRAKGSFFPNIDGGVFIFGQCESSINNVGIVTPDGFEQLTMLPLTKYGWGMVAYIGSFSAETFLSETSKALSSNNLRGITFLNLNTTFGYRVFKNETFSFYGRIGTGFETLNVLNAANTGIFQVQGSIAVNHLLPFHSVPSTVDSNATGRFGPLFSVSLGYVHRFIFRSPLKIQI